jgi:hypothetical protein
LLAILLWHCTKHSAKIAQPKATCKVFTGCSEEYDQVFERLIEARWRGEALNDARIKNSLLRAPDDGRCMGSMRDDGTLILNSVTSPTDKSGKENLQVVDPKPKKK